VERRAKEIQVRDIMRYAREVNGVRPLHEQLLIIDEFGYDNRDMLRQYGWFKRGQPSLFFQIQAQREVFIFAFLWSERFGGCIS